MSLHGCGGRRLLLTVSRGAHFGGRYDTVVVGVCRSDDGPLFGRHFVLRERAVAVCIRVVRRGPLLEAANDVALTERARTAVTMKAKRLRIVDSLTVRAFARTTSNNPIGVPTAESLKLRSF